MIGAIILALAPIALLIGLGHEIRRRVFLSDAFWPQAEKLSYYVLLPALFVHALAMADLKGVPVAGLAGTLIVTVLLGSAIVVAMRPLLAIDGAAFTSVFQGAIRFNNYVGVSAAVALFGASVIPLAAVANAAIVPTVNVLCVLVFARWGAAKPTFYGILRGIAVNPLVLGCAIGIALQVSGIGLPGWLEPCVRALGQASLPVGLLCVGAAFDWRALGRGIVPTVAATSVKFMVMPCIAAAAAWGFGLDARASAVAVMFMALPTASSSYVMARQLGGDGPLIAGIVALQTLLAAVAVPVALLLLTTI